MAIRTPTSPRPLAILGIDDAEELAYRVILNRRMATVDEVSTELAISSRKAQRLLDGIEAKGLVTHSPERPKRYIAAAPELAVEALISQRLVHLERARSSIGELRHQLEGATDAQAHQQVVEVITNPASLGQILTQLERTIKTEAICFQRAPILYARGFLLEKSDNVRVRSISDAGYLALPEAMALLRKDVEAGEEARVFPTLPVKLFVADRRIGLIPLNVADQGGAVMLVRASSLLDALCSLFELTWERATPIVFTRSGKLKKGKPDAALSEAAERIIPLLAAGLNDKAIAHDIGISDTTLTRRITELMKSFDTRTRFQLGWRAALETFPQRAAVRAKPRKKPASK
jgi:hypothetical protein